MKSIKIPLTLITGFLGAGESAISSDKGIGLLIQESGKSTLLQYVLQIRTVSGPKTYSPDRHILTERHGYRIAVIMNEFGDTAVRMKYIIDNSLCLLAIHIRI